jgi:hypothetical protein
MDDFFVKDIAGVPSPLLHNLARSKQVPGKETREGASGVWSREATLMTVGFLDLQKNKII